MSKLKTKRKKHYLAAAMLAMLAVATPITLYGSVTTYAQTDDAAGAESGEDTGEVTNEETGYHYQKTGEPLVEEKDNNGNIWRIYAAAENTASRYGSYGRHSRCSGYRRYISEKIYCYDHIWRRRYKQQQGW